MKSDNFRLSTDAQQTVVSHALTIHFAMIMGYVIYIRNMRVYVFCFSFVFFDLQLVLNLC